MNPRRYQLILAYLADERRQPAVMAATAVIIFVIGGVVLIALPAFQEHRDSRSRLRYLELEAQRQAPPEPDVSLMERQFAWDEILRKQANHDYKIRPSRLALIRKHWTELTLNMAPEDSVMLREQLQLDAPPDDESTEPEPTEPEPNVPEPNVPEPTEPEPTEPEPKEPEPKEPESKVPESKVPESKVPESKEPEPKEPEPKEPESKVPESKVPELMMPELIVPELVVPKSITE